MSLREQPRREVRGDPNWRRTHPPERVEKVVLHRLCVLRNLRHVVVSSDAFGEDGTMPVRYTADGAGLSPPLQWRSDVPAPAYGLLVEDIDAPAAHPVVHASVVNLNTLTSSLAEGALQSPGHDGCRVDPSLHRSFRQAWLPPHPAPQDGEHRYAFEIFALRFQPPFTRAPSRQEFIEWTLEFAVAGGCLFGRYQGAGYPAL